MSGEQESIDGGQDYEHFSIWLKSWFTESSDLFISIDWEGYMSMFSIQVSQREATNRKQS